MDLFLYICRWWRREREVNLMPWKILYSDLDFNFREMQCKSKGTVSSSSSDILLICLSISSLVRASINLT